MRPASTNGTVALAAETDPPDPVALADLLDRCAPLSAVPLCPQIRAFTATSLVEVWEAAEQVAGHVLQAPFWAFPWPAGIALARAIFDDPALVRGRKVFDVGAGGGVSCFAAAHCGAANVVACDIDRWALEVVRLGAQRQGLDVDVIRADITTEPDLLRGCDLILCGDLAYDRSTAARERAAISRAVADGALALLADAGRTYFDPNGLVQIAEYSIDVVRDLEGCDRRTTRVWAMR